MIQHLIGADCSSTRAVRSSTCSEPILQPEGALSEYTTHFGGASITNAEGTASAVAGPDADSASLRMRINAGRSAGQTTWRFRLSANTRVVFSAYGSVAATPGGGGNFAYADAAIVDWVGDLVNGSALTFSNEMYTRTGEFDGVLEATGFSGASDTDGLVQIRSLAAVAPVPEPAAYLLLLGGFGVLFLSVPGGVAAAHRISRNSNCLPFRGGACCVVPAVVAPATYRADVNAAAQNFPIATSTHRFTGHAEYFFNILNPPASPLRIRIAFVLNHQL
ncbi:hypothetical protein [Massilia phosphatilytica]